MKCFHHLNVNNPIHPVNKPPFAVDRPVDSLFPINVFFKMQIASGNLGIFALQTRWVLKMLLKTI